MVLKTTKFLYYFLLILAMKKMAGVFFIFFLLFTIVVYATHDARVSLSGYSPQYETNDVLFKLKVENIDDSVPPVNDSITNVTLISRGVNYLAIYDPDISWSHLNLTNYIMWNGSSGFLPDSINYVKFNANLDKVDEDKTYTWTAITKDTNGYLDINTFIVAVLNDSINPSIAINYPKDYSFVKNETFIFNFGVTDGESGVDFAQNSRIGYDDNNLPTTLADVQFNLYLTKSGDSSLVGGFNPALNMTNPDVRYLDYKIFDIFDKAGNSYVDSNTHHIYVDNDYPLVKSNFDSGFRTNNRSQGFSYNISDNSFNTRGKLSFDPVVNCDFYVGSSVNVNKLYIDSVNNSIVMSDLSTTADGTYNVALKCSDNATFSTTTDSQFILDTTGPAISSINPSNGFMIKNDTMITFIAGDDAGVSSVWYEYNNTNTTLSTYSISTSTWPDGLNILRIYANDTLNNVNTVLLTYTVDNTPPVIDFIAPVLGTLTNATVLVSYNATDAFSNMISCNTTANNGTYSVDDIRSLSNAALATFSMVIPNDGSWSFHLTCSDQAGNRATNTSSVTVDVTVPYITLESPLNLVYYNDTNILFVYNASDNNAKLRECNFYVNNNFNLTNVTKLNVWWWEGSNNFSQKFANGIHNWNIECKDIVYNNGVSGTRIFTVDTIQPSIIINYNKVKLEKQLDSIITNFTVADANKQYANLNIKDVSNNVLASTNNEAQTLSLSGLSLGVGNFVINAFANDSAMNSNASSVGFDVVDTLAPIILNYTPSNGSSFSSSTTSVEVNLTTDEDANCRYTTNSSWTYVSMSDMATTGTTKHSVSASVSAGNTYSYYFACSDGTNTMSSLHYITFSVNQRGNSGGGGGGNNGGGGRRRLNNEENNIQTTPQVNTPQPGIIPKVENKGEEKLTPPEETKAETTSQENSNDNQANKGFMGMTGMTILNGVNEYKKESLLTVTVISLGMLGVWGFRKYRKYKMFKMHKPPF